MPFVRASVVQPFFTGLPRDVVTNTFHFFWDGVTIDREIMADEIAARLKAFYEAVYNVIGCANYTVLPAWTVQCLVLDDPIPRVPEIRGINPAVTVFASNLPTEVACVMSYHAAPASGVVRQRLHNRIYIGNLLQSHISPSTTSAFPTFVTGLRNNIQLAAEILVGFNDGIVDWRQYSAAGGTPTFRTIVGGWVDNSPDTQRRRSVDATARTSFVLP